MCIVGVPTSSLNGNVQLLSSKEAAKQLEQEKLRRQEATRRRAKEAHNIGRNSVVAYSFADAVLSFLQSIFAW